MIVIETNKKTLDEAIDEAIFKMENSSNVGDEIYFKGLIDALLWVRNGGDLWVRTPE